MVKISDNGPILLVNQSAETSDHYQGNDYSLKWRGRTDNEIITQLQQSQKTDSLETRAVLTEIFMLC